MISLLNLKEPGEDVRGILHLMLSHWDDNPHFGNFHTQTGWLCLVREMIVDNCRAEGFIHDEDSGLLIAATIWTPAMDLHYGQVAQCIAHIVHPNWRGNTQLLRQLSKLRRKCIRLLCAEKYLDIKHISPTEQRQTLRFI